MLISHRKRFIYTKTRKTAGTSAEVYFEPYCMPEGMWEFSHYREEGVSEAGIVGCREQVSKGKKWFNHMSAESIKQQIGPTLWDQYFKFCVIRNPFDKVVSEFHHFRNRRVSRMTALRKLKSKVRLAQQALRGETVVDQFRRWIVSGGDVQDCDNYMIDGAVCVDYFIRYENLEEGIRHVCNVLKIPFEPERISRLKSGIRPARPKLNEYYDMKIIEIVAQRHKTEIDLFGYNAPM